MGTDSRIGKNFFMRQIGYEVLVFPKMLEHLQDKKMLSPIRIIEMVEENEKQKTNLAKIEAITIKENP